MADPEGWGYGSHPIPFEKAKFQKGERGRGCNTCKERISRPFFQAMTNRSMETSLIYEVFYS